MMVIVKLIISICMLTIVNAYYFDVKHKIITFLRHLNDAGNLNTNVDNSNTQKRFDTENDINGAILAKNKIKYIKNKKSNRFFNSHPIMPITTDATVNQEGYRIDPVLNFIRRKAGEFMPAGHDAEDYSSSSVETKDWKVEWTKELAKKKFEALNSTQGLGDTVDMVAGRPRGTVCGDPNQHDMPWGNCMLAVECEPEFRIYRGDYYCGRSHYVCCFIKYESYDLYQGFDESGVDTSLSSDVDNRHRGVKNEAKRKKRRQRRKLKRERSKRKRIMKKTIRKVVKDITKLLSRTYRNATNVKHRVTNQLKRYIREFKERYKKNKPHLQNIHNLDLKMIDYSLQKRLDEIKKFNDNFLTNSTFREAVIDGTIRNMDGWNSESLRMLVEDYPDVTNNGRRRLEYLKTLDNNSGYGIHT